jgi:hypothetical protein
MEEFVEFYPTNLGRCQDLFSYKNNIMQTPEKGVWSPYIVECLGRSQQMHWTELHARGGV